MKVKYLYSVLFVLTVMNIYLVLMITGESKKEEIPQTVLRPELEFLEASFLQYLSTMVKSSVTLEGRRIDENVPLEKSDGSQLTLAELHPGNQLIVADFQDISCKICVAEEIDFLSKLADQIGKDRIIVLYDFPEKRDRISFESNNGLATYKVVGEIEMPEAEPGEPFIFSISKDFKICDLYLPNKDLAEVSSTYYNCLAEKYK